MKKLLQSLFILMFVAVTAMAQDRTITGTVTASDDKKPLPGVSVKVKGAQGGTVTGADGKYSIRVSGTATGLTFTYLGYVAQTVSLSSNSINVVLAPDATTLSEVTVTSALGVKRSERSIGTAQQQLTAEKISPTKIADVNTAIAGKIAGTQISGGSGAKFGTSTIRIRGINTLNGGNPIYVVDGVITNPDGVNPDDIETLNVLKGPGATALYGQRGSEGAVVITTKKASKKSGVGVDVNHSTTFENVYILPKYQNEYGGGNGQTWLTYTAPAGSANAVLNGARYYDFSIDESWGPKFDGQPYAPWYAFDPTDPEYGKTKPWVAQPDNVKNFYETGVANNTSVALSKAGENSTTRFSFTNLTRSGVSPNSKQQKNWIVFNNTTNLSNRLSVTGNFNYVYEKRFNIPREGYGTQTAGSFNQWFHRDIEMEKLQRYQRPDGTFTTWNISGPDNLTPKFWDNPYVEVYKNLSESFIQRIYGSASATYDIGSGLKASVIARTNVTNINSDGRTASFTLNTPAFNSASTKFSETNYLANLAYDKEFGSFSLKAAVYGELMTQDNNNVATGTVGGFIVPNVYNVSNSLNEKSATNSFSRRKVNSLYAYTTLGYKNYLFLDLNLRNDITSTLPVANNSYWYGGAAGSFIFSEFTKDFKALSFGKLRASVARVGTDVGAYALAETFPLAATNYTKSSVVYPSQTVSNLIPNPELKPALSTAYEIGTELRFFKDRLRADFNFYSRQTKDQIINVTTPGSSGYTQRTINAGNIKNYGYEITLGGTPIRSKDFTWNADFNLGINKNKVIALAPGVDNILGGIDGSAGSFGFVGSPFASLNAKVGQASGFINGQGIVKDANGNKLIDDDGFYVLQDNMPLGSILPKFTGGFATSFTYKQFTLAGSLDFQKGGKLLSLTKMITAGSGLSEETAGLNDKGFPKRDDPSKGGGIRLEGVNATTGLPNTVYVDARELYETRLQNVFENWIYDASYVKLREVSLTYSLPKTLFKKLPFQRIDVSVIGQNLWLIYSKVKGIDPTELQSSWIDTAQLPGTRTVGFNVKFSL
ncbi:MULTISPECIES: SusC/RagA family TonB-linked outer membrane protein [unclassified Pedobacter]|uniref:SusC/RagA family TonB-linked outer membrane protein n=1 Tax=unclassified Pedobacter TaxID=2628915 RepID=UPI001423165F|nr:MULTISPECIES: SusC/RagA family TonB-linked outer membrane protein [unclassified Pedobacter]NII84299.1 TonB-linked SusC/RagA family outer membrane protein [Pedobacter sp. SG908]NMN38786.1 TonB-linked SusC/RagA family outer membrane protein [Pedobacter sp. SG918]